MEGRLELHSSGAVHGYRVHLDRDTRNLSLISDSQFGDKVLANLTLVD
jgi:hypothetical protein